MEHSSGKNKLHWPARDDINTYSMDDVLLILLKPLIPTNSRGDFKMDDTDHKMENGEMKHRYKITTRKIEVEYEQMLF